MMGTPRRAPLVQGSYIPGGAPPASSGNVQPGVWASSAFNPSQLFSRIGSMVPQQFQGAYNQAMQKNPLANATSWPGAGNAGGSNPILSALMGFGRPQG